MEHSPSAGWETRAQVELIDKIVHALHHQKALEPGVPIPGDPVPLRGLSLPTLTLCNELGLAEEVARRVSGRQQVYGARLRNVDLSQSNLSFFEWNDCVFNQVAFDEARLQRGDFRGCTLARCSFRQSNLQNARFDVSLRGTETEITDCVFDRCDLRGLTACKPVLRNVEFRRCKVKRLAFDEPLCDNVRFVGSYEELSFVGSPGEPSRNRLQLDLSDARVTWLHADHGMDLSFVRLPGDGSGFILQDRIRSVERICNEAAKRLDYASAALRMLQGIFGERSASPLSASQTTVYLSRRMVATLDESLSGQQIDELFGVLKSHGDSESG